jgi:S-DNA-T family DNA segregation ATPase FtsK/SpoIIIE
VRLRQIHDPESTEEDADSIHVDVDGDGHPDRVTPARRQPVGTVVPIQDAAGVDRIHPDAPDPIERSTLDRPADRGPDLTTQVYAEVRINRDPELRRIIPPCLRSREAFEKEVRRWIQIQWHRVRFHTVRAPAYTTRVLLRAPRGTARCLIGWTVWVLDLRASPMEQALATGARTDAKEFLKIREDRASRIRARLTTSALLGVLALVALILLVRSGPPWLQAIALLSSIGILARIGSDPGKPIAAPVMLTDTRYRELTDVIVMRALRSAGLGGAPAKLTKEGQIEIEDTRPTLAQPIQRAENGSGYIVITDLPHGKTVTDAAASADKLASGFDVEETQLFVEAVRGSNRRVSFYIADEDPFSLSPRRSPLARLPKVSVWDPHPIGTEPRGREVRPSLIFNSFLIGAIPRSGKTFAARALVSPGLLDPYCDITVLDF